MADGGLGQTKPAGGQQHCLPVLADDPDTSVIGLGTGMAGGGKRLLGVRPALPDAALSFLLVCAWVGLEVSGVSLVTNAGAGYTGEPLTHEEVIESGKEAGPRLARVIRRFVADLPPA